MAHTSLLDWPSLVLGLFFGVLPCAVGL